jgi:CheY-like chemotaxis protein
MTNTGASRRGCVLVVDDEEGVRDSLCDLVELVGCSAVGASNGREALDFLAEKLPCLIVLDLLMPVMSGHEFLTKLQQHPGLATVPVVISTSAPDDAPAGVPVIAKPIDVERFLELMRRACSCAAALPMG